MAAIAARHETRVGAILAAQPAAAVAFDEFLRNASTRTDVQVRYSTASIVASKTAIVIAAEDAGLVVFRVPFERVGEERARHVEARHHS